MPYAWSSDLETGHAAIDIQHKRIIDAVNALFDAHKSGKGRQEVKKTVEFLVAYTIKHFADEEQLQKEYNYPGYYAHKNLHNEFKRAAQALAEELSQDAPTDEFVSKVYVFVGEWLSNHIQGDDFSMAAYVKKAKRQRDKAGAT